MALPSEAATSPASPRYGGVAISFHWVLALAIVASFSLGVYMHDLPFSIARIKLFNCHKWAGITILALSLLRLLWRLTHRPPPLSPRQLAVMPAWQQRAAKVSHGLMYVLFFAVPLLGWAYSSAAGLPIVWFGVLPLPDFVPVNKRLGQRVAQATALPMRRSRWAAWCCCTWRRLSSTSSSTATA